MWSFFKLRRRGNFSLRLVTLWTFFLAISVKVHSQTPYNFELKSGEVYKEMDFACLRVIDKREDKERLGLIYKTSKGKIYVPQFEQPFEAYLKTYLNKGLSAEGKKDSLVFIFHELWVYEKGITRKCYVEMELAREKDGSLYSLGIFESLQVGGGGSMRAHAKRVKQAIKACLYSFQNSNWKNNQGELIDLDAPKYEYDPAKIPVRGLYMSFGQLARSSPMLFPEDFRMKQYESTKYLLRTGEGDINQYVKYVSDGDNIYMNTGKGVLGYEFVKSKHLGRYVYFEKKVQNSKVPIAPSLGIIGVAPALLSKMTIVMILDTKRNVVDVMDELLIYRLTKKNHPEILEEYRNSSRKQEDMEKAILDLNARYQTEE